MIVRTPFQPQRPESAFAWLWRYITPHWASGSVLLALSLLASALVLLQPWLTKLLIDDGLLARNYSYLITLAVTMIGVGLLGTVLSGVNRYLHTRLSATVLFSLREDLYAHLQTLSPAFYAHRRTGDIMSRLDGDVSEIQRFAVDSLFSAVTNTLGLLGAMVLMVSLSWELSLGVLLLVPLQALYLTVMRRKVEQGVRRLRERSADLSSFLVETLTSIKFIQAMAGEQRETQKLQGLSGHYLKDLLQLQITEFFTAAVPSTMASLARAGVFLIGGYWVIEGRWQLGSLIAFSTYLGMALGPVQGLLGLYVAWRRMTVSLDRVMELRRQPPAILPPSDPHALPQPLLGHIRLEGVEFCFPERQPVLDGADADFPAGCKIALSGDSGVGKTTLIDLIHRFYDPQRGRILLDGIDLRELDLTDLRRSIAVVSQDLVVFRGTVADNIRYARPQATDEEVRTAANDASLGEWIATLPQGLNTPLGERGARLSGGQRQRLAIAQALLVDATVLILDEATSAVDETTEAQIIAAVDRLFVGRTRILISHRASALATADLRFTLQSGKLNMTS